MLAGVGGRRPRGGCCHSPGGHDSGLDQVESRSDRSLSLPVPCLLSPAEKEKLGAFQVMAFGQVIRAKM